MTSAYGGVLSALDVRYSLKPVEGELLVGEPTSKTHPLSKRLTQRRPGNYIEKETIYAVYEDRRDLLVSESREIILDD